MDSHEAVADLMPMLRTVLRQDLLLSASAVDSQRALCLWGSLAPPEPRSEAQRVRSSSIAWAYFLRESTLSASVRPSRNSHLSLAQVDLHGGALLCAAKAPTRLRVSLQDQSLVFARRMRWQLPRGPLLILHESGVVIVYDDELMHAFP